MNPLDDFTEKPHHTFKAKYSLASNGLLHRPASYDTMLLKQKKFCEAYIQCKEPKKAAMQAGYSEFLAEQAGLHLTNDLKCREYLTYLWAKELDKMTVDFNWKLKKLQAIVEGCLDGKCSEKQLMNARDAITGIAEMNKMQGDYKPVQVESKSSHIFDVGNVEALIDGYQKEY